MKKVEREFPVVVDWMKGGINGEMDVQVRHMCR